MIQLICNSDEECDGNLLMTPYMI